MGKKGGLFAVCALSAVCLGGFFTGNGIYNKTVRSRKGEAKALSDDENAKTSREYLNGHKNARTVMVDSIDFLRLRGLYLEQDNAPKEGEEGVLHDYCILLHQEHADCGVMGHYARHYYENGYSVLIPDLRGCGDSDGNYAGFGYDDRLDVSAWVDWILKRNAKAKIIIHGLSSGASAALNASAGHLPDAVMCIISDSAFTDGEAFFGHFIKYGTGDLLPVRIKFFLFRLVTLIRAGFDPKANRPIDAVKNSRTPTLFLHADADNIIPVRMCNELYTAATCQREYGTFLNAPHLKSEETYPQRYWKRVDDFIEKSRKRDYI